jgi:restriction endonuclease S subunit
MMPNQRLGDIICLEYGKPLPEADRDGFGRAVVAGSNGVQGLHSQFLVKGPGIVVGRKGSAGQVNWFNQDFWPIDTTYYVVPKSKLNLRWVYYFLRSAQLTDLANATGVPGLNRNDVYELPVKVPTFDEQERISGILDEAEDLRHLRAEATARTREVNASIFEALFSAKQAAIKGWPTKALGELTSNVSGGTPSTENPEFWSGPIPWISPKDMKCPELLGNDFSPHVSRRHHASGGDYQSRYEGVFRR